MPSQLEIEPEQAGLKRNRFRDRFLLTIDAERQQLGGSLRNWRNEL
jgi:hypothetical protein